MDVDVDVALFSRLFISCQARESDLDDFFSHENQAAPPSLSFMGKLGSEKNKSDILRYILPVSPVTVNKSPTLDAKILDGAVAV